MPSCSTTAKLMFALKKFNTWANLVHRYFPCFHLFYAAKICTTNDATTIN
jgi:hypothetical protein